MYGYFSFEMKSETDQSRTLVLFCASSTPSLDDVISVIRNKVSTMLSPDAIVLLGFESEAEILINIKDNSRFIDSIPPNTRHSNPPPIFFTAIPRTGLSDDIEIGPIRWKNIRDVGLLTIFKKRDALLICPPTYHFAKPSGRHADRFIWAANSLVDGAEVMFIAAQCLPNITLPVRHYYCDTGAIGSLAFAIDSLIRRFDRDSLPGTVNTFGSYEGLKSFEFRDCESSIVLVSASTSGGLEKAITKREPRISPDKIITLFSAASQLNGGRVLLDLTIPWIRKATIGNFTSYSETDCPHCHRKSIPVPMLGDQFIPARSETKSILIRRLDAPSWLSRFLESTGRKRILKAFYRSPQSPHATTNVFIDMETIIIEWDTKNGIAQRLKRLVDQVVPIATKRIVHLDDNASKILANVVHEHIKSLGDESVQIEVVAARDARELNIMDEGATVVVAAAIASGHSLLGMSQTLREIQKTNSIVYLVGLTRMSSRSELVKLECDIRMGEVANDFSFHLAESIYLPLESFGSQSSWDEELQLLKELANTAENEERNLLEERIKFLTDSQSVAVRGLVDKLFWQKTDGEDLALRHGFVFFPKSMSDSPNECSQGDVYFTIVSVLHNMRHRDLQNDALCQTEYERRVISPLTFDRFNDGVIQAAILRAALRPELDYASSHEESHSMTVILQSILGSKDSEKGEAIREFLLAIALRRLTLTERDLRELIEKYSTSETDWLCCLLWREIQRHLEVTDA